MQRIRTSTQAEDVDKLEAEVDSDLQPEPVHLSRALNVLTTTEFEVGFSA